MSQGSRNPRLMTRDPSSALPKESCLGGCISYFFLKPPKQVVSGWVVSGYLSFALRKQDHHPGTLWQC